MDQCLRSLRAEEDLRNPEIAGQLDDADFLDLALLASGDKKQAEKLAADRIQERQRRKQEREAKQ